MNYISPDDDLKDFLDIKYLYELNWRLERCLCPLINNLNEIFESVLRRYWLYPCPAPEEGNVISPSTCTELCGIDLYDLRTMWQHLSLSLLRYYREQGLLEKREDLDKTITTIYEYLSPDQKSLLHYERVLFSMFRLDIDEAQKQIDEWSTENSLPFMEAKRASIMAELGDMEAAEQILKRSLGEIRKQLNLSPLKRDYTLTSQEAYIMYLLNNIERSRHFMAGEIQETRGEYKERWNELKKYKCDPFYEWRLFQLGLERPPVPKKDVSVVKSFDIGRISRSFHLGSENIEALVGYEYLRFCEDAGIPFRTGNFTFGAHIAKGALKRIYKYSPYWALASLVRIGDDKTVDEIFNRESLHSLSVDQVDSLVNQYITALRRSKNVLENQNETSSQQYAVQLAHTLPEMLSRLCCKCSLDSKDQLLFILLELYECTNTNPYSDIHHLLERLLKSYSSSQQVNIIPKLLTFPIPKNFDVVTATKFKNPFLFLDFDYIADKTKFKPDQKHLDNLFAEAVSEEPLRRKWAIFTLVQFYQFGLLPKKCTAKLRNTLYSQRDDFGFPKSTDFYRFAFHDLPRPEKMDFAACFKRYIQETQFPIQGDNNTYGIGDDTTLFRELLNCPSLVKWEKAEINIIFVRLMECWDTDKNQLKKEQEHDFMSIHQGFQQRFIMLAKVVVDFIIPNLKGHDDVKDKLERFMQELDEYGVFSLRVKAACVRIVPDTKREVINNILKSLRSYEHDEVVYCLKTIYMICDLNRSGFSKKDKTTLIWHIAQKISWRQPSGLASALNIMSHLLHTCKHDSLMTQEAKALILGGLRYLDTETDYKKGLEQLDFFDKLEIRRAAVCLSYELYKWYMREGADIPKVILQWKEIAQSEDEFAEVKNQWLD